MGKENQNLALANARQRNEDAFLTPLHPAVAGATLCVKRDFDLETAQTFPATA